MGAAIAAFDGAFQRLERTPRLGCQAQVMHESPARESVEPIGELGLETEAGQGEEWMTVGDPGIDRPRAARQEHIERMFNGPVDAKVSTESITGTAGNEPEGCSGINQRGGNFVQGAVTADRDDQLETCVQRGARELGGVPRMSRERDPGPLFFRECLHNRQCASRGAGARVDDELGFQSVKIESQDRVAGDEELIVAFTASAQAVFTTKS